MASFSVMNAPVVRVQLPAGDPFVPAFVDAAAKFASRRSFSPEGVETFVDMVRMSVAAMNSSAPSAIELAVTELADRVEAVVQCTGPTAGLSSASLAKLKTGAKRCLAMTTADDPPVVRFSLGLD